MALKFAGSVRFGTMDGSVAKIWYVTNKQIFNPPAIVLNAASTLLFFSVSSE